MERTAQKEDVNKFRVELKSQGIEEVSRQKQFSNINFFNSLICIINIILS